ncbi:DNA-binding transcriptional regulator, MerR family [Fodinibius roseus]|uniref:DNA-binding transcriptional regulator, MerR family n=2 Tax=Fodinibius roseus TaxID=1194090 RepID=A0A1M5IYT9_9BACT|nr:DNA-binding transcriptional regulator, MerR family [Fodinibius roseus]
MLQIINMDTFSISQISQFSGVKPHTIRMWEQRYGALKPNRSEGNTRYYSNAQLRRLLNIVSLKNAGYKLGELGAMPDEKLNELVLEEQEQTTTDQTDEYFVLQLIAAGMSYDELYFEKVFSHCLLRYGMTDAYSRIIYPVMVRLGLMWTSDRMPPVQEHFLSNLLRQKLLTAIDSLPPAEPEADKWLLFLPENEFHELGLLFAHYLIRRSGHQAIYLGANVPLQLLRNAVADTGSDRLLFFLVHNDLPENSRTYLDQLKDSIPDKTIYLSGNRDLISQLKTGKSMIWLKSVEHLEQQLNA